MKTVTIKKPIYATYIAIRDIYLTQAIKKKEKLRVIIPQGTYIVDPKIWIKTGRKQKKVFLIPDNPMILYENHCERFPQEPKYEFIDGKYVWVNPPKEERDFSAQEALL